MLSVEFRKAGWNVDFYTVNGLPPQAEPGSLRRTGPLSLFGLGVSKANSPESRHGRELTEALTGVRLLTGLDADQIDALYLPGGLGCMFDMNRDRELHRIILQMYKKNKLLSGVCHATSTFALVKEQEHSIVANKRITGFPKRLDQIMQILGLIDRKFLPLPLSNDDLLTQAGARLRWYHRLWAIINPRYTRIDRPFVTGMGPKAASTVARKVIGLLG